MKHDAATVWLEDVSAGSFKICLRELQNFAGVHDDISVNWLAFTTLHRPLFSEHNDVSFQNRNLPSKNHNFAFCADVSFIRSYNKYPTVLLTAKHSSSGGKKAPECNGIVSWIEFINNSGFRFCVKELFAQRFDPLTVSYAVLSDVCSDDWTYFKGYCYRKVTSCDSWSNSQGKCSTLGANLPSIHSQEENVYVQNLHGGEHAWLGLSDINSEGKFVWSDGTPFDFHYWAKHQPNNFRDEDCVHTLGSLRDHEYKWNDVNCSDCHGFTCKKDYNECQGFSDDCPVNATCVNNDGSYSCQCPSGHRLDGNTCKDVNECQLGSYSCHSQAECVNAVGSYICRCLPGYTGDGKNNCQALQPCTAVGVADANIIPNGKITSSSVYLRYYSYKGRLNGALGWCAYSPYNRNDFIQVDIGAVRSICAVATQGKKNGSYVTSYKLLLSSDGVSWTTYQEQNVDKIFQANSDLNTVVQHSLANAAQARYVRFYPVTHNQYPCMRIEVYAH